jgi:hypothetical protein
MVDCVTLNPQLQIPQLQIPQLQIPQLQIPQLQIPQLQIPQLQVGFEPTVSFQVGFEPTVSFQVGFEPAVSGGIRTQLDFQGWDSNPQFLATLIFRWDRTHRQLEGGPNGARGDWSH